MYINIREATESDYTAIRQLMLQSWQYHISLRPDTYIIPTDFFNETVYKQLMDQRHMLVAVCDNNKIAGAVSYTISTVNSNNHANYKSLWIADLVVDEHYRRQGIATILFNEIKTIAKTNDVERIELNVDAANNNAIAMYKKQGFNESNIRMSLSVEKE